MADDCGEKDGEYVGVVGVSGEQRDGYLVPVEVSPLSWPRDREAKAELYAAQVDVDGHKFSGSTAARLLLAEAATDDCC